MLVLHPEESLVLTVRKHWLAFALANLYLPVLGLLPAVFRPAIQSFFSSNLLFAFAYLLWFLLLWSLFAVDWTNYYLDVWQITDERLIDVEQKGIFFRDEATTRLELIQDVTIETSGLLATLFGFGDIRVQTAGESREFIMRQVAQPEAVKAKIEELIRAERQS